MKPAVEHPSAGPDPRPRAREGRALLARWRWVIAYSAFLLGSVSLTREVIGWLQDRELTGLLGIGLLLVAAAGAGFLLYRMRGPQGRVALPALLRLALFLSLYGYLAVALTVVTVERIHFVEYGILGLLCFQAADWRHGQARRVVYAITAAFFVGFVDEVIQGLVELRYYDEHDVILNLCAVGLPVLGLLWLPWKRGDRATVLPAGAGEGDAGGLPGGFPSPTPLPAPLAEQRAGPATLSGRTAVLRLPDLLVPAVAAGVALCMLWIPRVQWDLTELPGLWERDNTCGVHEWMEIRDDRVIRWWDADGNQAEARYEVGGNRLDGPLLVLRVVAGEGKGLCVWQKGMGRNHYFEVDGDRLVFKKRVTRSFTRVKP